MAACAPEAAAAASICVFHDLIQVYSGVYGPSVQLRDVFTDGVRSLAHFAAAAEHVRNQCAKKLGILAESA